MPFTVGTIDLEILSAESSLPSFETARRHWDFIIQSIGLAAGDPIVPLRVGLGAPELVGPDRRQDRQVPPEPAAASAEAAE